MNDIRRVLSYNDVLLCPRYSGLEHLSDANIKYDYPGMADVYPIINAPMDKVCSVDLIKFMDSIGCPTTIHRWFNSPEEQLKFFELCNIPGQRCFIAVGNVAKWKDWIDKIISYSVKKVVAVNFLVDVANGDTKSAVDTVKYIKEHASWCSIIAGNVATKAGFRRLQEAGANFIRVGVGGGSICSTRIKTGFGIPTLTSVMDCATVKDNAYLIADGGIENSGDICKAMIAGADMVMIGKILASTSLSNGKKYDYEGNITDDESKYKWVAYSGMASKEANEKLKSKKSIVSIEGVSGFIPYTGKTEEVMINIFGNLQSAVAYYAGCRNWKEFKKSVKMVEITTQGWNESLTRINNII
jgi:IMP dehydrogenase